jgi:hypothetical protein
VGSGSLNYIILLRCYGDNIGYYPVTKFLCKINSSALAEGAVRTSMIRVRVSAAAARPANGKPPYEVRDPIGDLVLDELVKRVLTGEPLRPIDGTAVSNTSRNS